MIINGREIGFFHSVEAHCEIASFCPKHDISHFGELLEGDYLAGVDVQRKFILALNKGYEKHKAHEDPNYTANPLTEAELDMLEVTDFLKLFEEAGNAFAGGNERTVESEEPKNSKKKAENEALS